MWKRIRLSKGRGEARARARNFHHVSIRPFDSRKVSGDVMGDREGTPIDSCVWCGGAHSSLECPEMVDGCPPTRLRLTDEEIRTVYGVIGRMVATTPRPGESGFDRTIPLHKRVLICGVTPDELEAACDPGPRGGVKSDTLSRLRAAIARVAP